MDRPPNNSAEPFVEPLTRREREILGLLAQGHSAPEIASNIVLGLSTVKSHIQHIYSKLGVTSKRQALARAQALGLLKPAPTAAEPIPAEPIPAEPIPAEPIPAQPIPAQPAVTPVSPLAEPPAPSAPLISLPQPSTPFIGREKELAALAALLADAACRLVTLVGPGGTGKSRLAVQAAAAQSNAGQGGIFPDGLVFVPLAALSSPEYLVAAVADALNLKLSGRREPREELLAYLQPKTLLLVLDNCEHLLDGAELFGEILRAAPGIKLLATSRQRLNLQAEWLFELDGLTVPDTWGAEAGQGALALFAQSARRLRPGAITTEADQAAVVRICQLVGGMPLAVELAAAWVRVLSCAEIADEIGRSLGILAGEARDLPARQQSMQAVYDQSWRLLTAVEQQAFARLSVFRGGFLREAAQQVAEAGLVRLSALVDKSLIRVGPAGRYELHELARQYAAEKLSRAADAAAFPSRHLTYYLDLAERAAPELAGPGQAAWLDRLDAEHDNLRAALAWAQTAGDTDQALRLAGALWRFWFLRGHLEEGDKELRRILALPGGEPHRRAVALAGAAFIAHLRREPDQVSAWADASLALAREAGDVRLAALSLILLGEAQVEFHDGRTAFRLFGEGLAVARESGDRWTLAFALAQISQADDYENDFPALAAQAAESVALARVVGDRWLLALALHRHGIKAGSLGDLAAARGLHEEGLAIQRELGDRLGMATALWGLSVVAYGLGNVAEGRALSEQRLALERELNNREGVVEVMNRMAWRDVLNDDYAGATVRIESALAICREFGLAASAALQLDLLGQLALLDGQYEHAVAKFEESLSVYLQMQRAGEPSGPTVTGPRRQYAVIQTHLGYARYLLGRLPQAQASLEAALAVFHELRDNNGMGWVPPLLGCIAIRAGDLARARALIEEGLANCDPNGVFTELAFALLSLGDVTRLEGDLAGAAGLYRRSLRIMAPYRPILFAVPLPDFAQYLESFAKLALAAMEPDRAARLFGAAAAQRDRSGLPLPPVDRADYDQAVAETRRQLDPAAFDAAWAAGLALNWEQAMEFALEE